MNYDDATLRFTPQKVEPFAVAALSRLFAECEKEEVEIQEVKFFQNGFCVTFKDVSGDAICHTGSYGRTMSMWETIGMPWDYDDVSVHEAEDLVKLIKALKDGNDWRGLEQAS